MCIYPRGPALESKCNIWFHFISGGKDDQESNRTITGSQPNTVAKEKAAKTPAQPVEPKELHLVLRLRNEQRELHDIKFEFTVGKDTSHSVSQELVEAGLVNGQDLIVMAANLDKILEKKEKQIVFRLNSGCGPNEAPCDKSLLGFAQLTLVDWLLLGQGRAAGYNYYILWKSILKQGHFSVWSEMASLWSLCSFLLPCPQRVSVYPQLVFG